MAGTLAATLGRKVTLEMATQAQQSNKNEESKLPIPALKCLQTIRGEKHTTVALGFCSSIQI